MEIRSIEDVVFDELSSRHISVIEEEPRLKEWLLQGIAKYAEHIIDLASEVPLETNGDNREYFDNFPDTDWELDNNGHIFRVDKQSILDIKQLIK